MAVKLVVIYATREPQVFSAENRSVAIAGWVESIEELQRRGGEKPADTRAYVANTDLGTLEEVTNYA